jgi:ketosteroid isomerase-like protein
MAVAGTPTKVVREMFEALDRKDFAKVLDLTAADVQSVDEISRGWLRGRPAMADYLETIAEDVSNIRTTLRDIHESVIGELAIVTLGITQRYDLRGQLVEVQAPTSIIARRESSGWRVILFHSVPLSDAS